jgi:uridylate kinase
MKIVISIGGSLLYPKDSIDVEYAKKFANFAKELSKKHQLVLVVGGGKLARKYIEMARKFGASEVFCDLLGIEATRMNARLLSVIIGEKANMEPPKDFVDALKALDFGKIVVMGGTDPGHSTDAVAAIIAEYINANLLINATNVDGVYDKNPNAHKDARLYKKISVKKLIDILKDYSINAGKYELMDIVAAKVIQRSKIKCIFLNGKKLRNLKNAIEGKRFIGTVIE